MINSGTTRPQVVLVEDDEIIREATQLGLIRLGYDVTTFADGLEGLQYVQATNVDMVLLDVMLPTMNGASVCRALRATSSTPVIMLSARTDAVDMISGLDSGADDYIAKPFDLEVLDARIRAVLRRSRTGAAPETAGTPSTENGSGHGFPATDTDPAGDILRVGALAVNTASLEVSVDGRTIHLTPTELRILLTLCEEPGSVYSRTRILGSVWGYEWDGDQRIVDVHVQRLRGKIGSTHVETVRGFGYRLVAGGDT